MAVQYNLNPPSLPDILSSTYGQTGAGYGLGANTNTGGQSAQLVRDLAGIQYQRESTGQQYGWGDLTQQRQVADQRRAIPGSFNRRGMLDSGLYQRGMRRSYEEELLQQAMMEQAMSAQLGSLGQQQIGVEGGYAYGVGQTALADAQRRILANQIRDAF